MSQFSLYAKDRYFFVSFALNFFAILHETMCGRRRSSKNQHHQPKDEHQRVLSLIFKNIINFLLALCFFCSSLLFVAEMWRISLCPFTQENDVLRSVDNCYFPFHLTRSLILNYLRFCMSTTNVKRVAKDLHSGNTGSDEMLMGCEFYLKLN